MTGGYRWYTVRHAGIAAGSHENLARHNRGFGFMPPINLSRAAQSAIAAIEARLSAGSR